MKVSKFFVGILIYIKNLNFWAKKKVSVKLWTYGEKWPQWFDLLMSISNFSFDLSVSGAWQSFEDRLCGHFEMLQAKIGQEM